MFGFFLLFWEEINDNLQILFQKYKKSKIYVNKQKSTFKMNLNKEHLDFEILCKQLIGMTILKVEYSEINYNPENPKPYYPTQFENLDSVDFSIFLHMDNDKLVEIFWDGKFFQYGIGIKINEPSDFSEFIKWDVSNNRLWQKFIGTSISNFKITWETVSTIEQKYGSIEEEIVYPQDIKITFSNHLNIFVSAAGIIKQDDKEVYGMLDNLMVTDKEEVARIVKMIN